MSVRKELIDEMWITFGLKILIDSDAIFCFIPGHLDLFLQDAGLIQLKFPIASQAPKREEGGEKANLITQRPEIY